MDRKAVVTTLEEILEVKAKYMGAPSFSYLITKSGETYTIDRQGRITTEADLEIDIERFIYGENHKKEESVNRETIETEIVKTEIAISMEGHTGATLRNLINMFYSKQALIKKALDIDEEFISTEFVTTINKREIYTLEDFKSALGDVGANKCRGINFNFQSNTITFILFKNLDEPDIMDTYTKLFTFLSNSSKALKYASPKLSVIDNEKFTMRTWLIRLGFVGSEFKKERKILLKNLDGNGAFRNV